MSKGCITENTKRTKTVSFTVDSTQQNFKTKVVAKCQLFLQAVGYCVHVVKVPILSDFCEKAGISCRCKRLHLPILITKE